MNFLKISSAVLLFAVAVAVPEASAACSDANLTGVWGFQVGTAVGQFKADGHGKLTGSVTINQNGTILMQSFTGTYSVKTNCTGNLTTMSSGGTAHFYLVLDEGKKGFQIIDTDAGGTAEGIGVAQGVVTCGLTGIKHTFAAELLGKIINTGGIAYVAQMILDGNGNVSGSGIFDVAGTTVMSSFKGLYTEDSVCSGTIQIMPSKFNTLNFYFVVVNSGKEILLLDTDSNAQVAGNMQQ
jgi:hypothetical protein